MGIAAWPPEAGPRAAPMPLLLLQAFVNTAEIASGGDVLGDPASAREWLVRAGLLGPSGRLAAEDLELIRAVREAFRSLLVGNAGGPVPSPSDLSPLRTLASATWLHPTLGGGGRVELQLESADDAPALGRLLVVVRDAQREGTWGRLKACRDERCRRAFFDRSHARRGA